MKTATSLTVIAVGAILAFAVTATPGFLNIQIVGWILMITGAIGLTLSRNNREWLRRTVIVRGSPDASRTSRRRSTTYRRRPARQLVAAHPAPAGPDVPAPRTAPEAAASPNAPTEEIEPVTIEEFMEQ
ncbi:MAG TPA: DUF6458 family protein [Streptosporangiaceae bacterium]|jgi:hypothetical protein